MPLGEGERAELLRIARQTLEAYLGRREWTPVVAELPSLTERRGAFVTLERHGVLRGCIGHMADDRPLALCVQEMAIQAATADPRFPPVTIEELPEIEIEISALTPFRQVSDFSEIQVGQHGLLVVKGTHRGVLLPQVATREHWDRETFLSYTCLKAGLPFEDWRSGEAQIFVFQAEVFGERAAGSDGGVICGEGNLSNE